MTKNIIQNRKIKISGSPKFIRCQKMQTNKINQEETDIYPLKEKNSKDCKYVQFCFTCNFLIFIKKKMF